MSESLSILTPLTLQLIRKVESDDVSSTCTSPTTFEISTLPETRVLVEVDTFRESSWKTKCSCRTSCTSSKSTESNVSKENIRENGENKDAEKSGDLVLFDCPVFILQYSSPRLASILSKEMITAFDDPSDQKKDTRWLSPSASDYSMRQQAQEVVRLRLPFSCSVDSFETVALYMEHFYGVNCLPALHHHSSDPSGSRNRNERTVLRTDVGYSDEQGTDNTRCNESNDNETDFSREDFEKNFTLSHSISRPFPTVLEPPLKFTDLYHLQQWEVQFVWQRLLDLPGVLRARLYHSRKMGMISVVPDNPFSGVQVGSEPKGHTELSQLMDHFFFQSRWVDALGSPTDSTVTSCSLTVQEPSADNEGERMSDSDSLSLGRTRNSDYVAHNRSSEDAAGEVDCSTNAKPVKKPSQIAFSMPSVNLSLTVQEKQAIAHRILSVLEVSSQLQMLPLQSLCAALIANMIVDLDEDEMRCVLHPPTQEANAHGTLAPFDVSKAGYDSSSSAGDVRPAEEGRRSFPLRLLPTMTEEREEHLYLRYPWAKTAARKEAL